MVTNFPVMNSTSFCDFTSLSRIPTSLMLSSVMNCVGSEAESEYSMTFWCTYSRSMRVLLVPEECSRSYFTSSSCTSASLVSLAKSWCFAGHCSLLWEEKRVTRAGTSEEISSGPSTLTTFTRWIMSSSTACAPSGCSFLCSSASASSGAMPLLANCVWMALSPLLLRRTSIAHTLLQILPLEALLRRMRAKSKMLAWLITACRFFGVFSHRLKRV